MMTFKYEITSLVFCIFLTKCCPAGQTLDIHSNNKCISSSHEESNSSTVYVTDSNEEKTVGENLLYEAPATDTYECEQYNFEFPVSRGKSGKYIVGHQGPKSYLASEACWDDIYSGRIFVIDQACLPCFNRLQCSDQDIYPLNPRKSWNITDSEYCIDTSKHDNKLLFCPEEINYKYLTSAIFNKCCPDGQVLDISYCISSNKRLTNTFTENSTDN